MFYFKYIEEMMDQLITQLLTGNHPVLFEPRTEDINEIKERLNQGFVFIKFTETQGGTELGVNVDGQLTRLNEGNFETNKGAIQVVGTCELNFQKVRCIADIDLSTRQGIGRIELLQEL